MRCYREGMDLVGNVEAADYIGVEVSTWRAYVARKFAPAADGHHISKGHAMPVWHQETLDRWQASRRGQAWRRSA